MPEAIYLVTAVKLSTQVLVKTVKINIRSAIGFKTRFRIHKSDIKTKKDRCGTARHFNTKCSGIQNSHRFFQVQLIESVVSDLYLENKLWEREKYW